MKFSIGLLIALMSTSLWAPLSFAGDRSQSGINLKSEQNIKVSNDSSASIGDVVNTSKSINEGSSLVNDIDNPVSTAYAASMSPSAQCMGVATGGVQGWSVGVSLGKSYESKPCNQRELARMLAQIGKTEAAMDVLCSMEDADVVKECTTRKQPQSSHEIQSTGLISSVK